MQEFNPNHLKNEVYQYQISVCQTRKKMGYYYTIEIISVNSINVNSWNFIKVFVFNNDRQTFEGTGNVLLKDTDEKPGELDRSVLPNCTTHTGPNMFKATANDH